MIEAVPRWALTTEPKVEDVRDGGTYGQRNLRLVPSAGMPPSRCDNDVDAAANKNTEPKP